MRYYVTHIYYDHVLKRWFILLKDKNSLWVNTGIRTCVRIQLRNDKH